MFERMQRAYRFTRRPPEFSTHPLSETRIADAKNQARSYPTREPKSIAFQMMKVKVGLYETTRSCHYKNTKSWSKKFQQYCCTLWIALALVKNSSFEEAVNEFEALRPRLPNTILMLAAYAEVLPAQANIKKLKIVQKRLVPVPTINHYR